MASRNDFLFDWQTSQSCILHCFLISLAVMHCFRSSRAVLHVSVDNTQETPQCQHQSSGITWDRMQPFAISHWGQIRDLQQIYNQAEPAQGTTSVMSVQVQNVLLNLPVCFLRMH